MTPAPTLGIAGALRVSVSRTAGHTKRAQTVPLTPGLSLLDCPGLVFPHALGAPAGAGATAAAAAAAGVPPPAMTDAEVEERACQELLGVIPIAQVREPYTAVRYLAERLPLAALYGLALPRGDGEWTPLSLCEALATKRGTFIARVGRPDAHAAGRQILYDAQDGIIPMSWLPPPPPPAAEAEAEAEVAEATA